MGGLFSEPKSVKVPPVSSTPAIPEVGGEVADETRKQMVRSGRAKTKITGNLVPTSTGKKTVLG